MATTQQPLVWDFYRSVDSDLGLGGVIHYHDEASQSIYLNGGLATKVAAIPEGHWSTAALSSEYKLTNDSFSALRLDHPSNGTVYGVATDGTTVTFLRYIYGMDISQITDSWSWLTQTDNAIAQFDSTVQNIDPEIFVVDSSLFQPGAKLTLDIFVGESNAYPIGTVWLDESGYDRTATTVNISGRNTIGYFLKDQTFDDNTKFSGTTSKVVTAILTYAGLSNFVVQTLETTKEFEFKPSDTLLAGIEEILDFYTTLDEKMEMVELPDGTILIGYDYWIANYITRGYYSFDEGRDVFKRNTVRAADGTFVSLRATGKDSDGNELAPVTIPISNFPYWALGNHRTKHVSAPDGLTQKGLQTWAEAQAKTFQYVGIAEDFTGPFRPHLIVGDVAEVVHGEVGTSLGIVTQVKQSFSRQNGFVTEFSVDSGGVAIDGDSYTVYSRSASIHGYNRRQNIVDLVRYTAEKARSVESLTAKDIGAEQNGTSTIKITEHNDSPAAHPYLIGKIAEKLPTPAKASVGQYLRVLQVDSDGKVLSVEAVNSPIPTYTEDDYGKVLSCTSAGLVWVKAESASSDLPQAEDSTF